MCANCPETPILWQYPAEDQDPLQEISLGGTISLATIISSPAIGDDERHSIYVGSSSGSVFAFYDGPRISGRAVLVAADGETKSPFRAVKMTLTSEFETKERVTYTDTNGYYEFAGVENYAYTVTPEKFGYVFGPQSATAVVKQDQDAKNIDFEAFTGFTISGTINDSANSIPVSGVTVTIDGVNTVPASTVTDASGQYAFTGLSFDTYSITPSLQGYGFTPPFQQVTIASDDAVKDKTNIDFTATRGYQISGKVIDIAVADEVDNGIQGVNISLTGAMTASATTDANGAYSFVGLENGTYTVTPRFINYSFEPASQTVTVASGHVNNLDFFAATGSSISGYILDLDNATLANVTVGLYDATRRTSFITQAQEDEPRNTVHPLGSGRYVFIGVGSGTYTIKPRLAGHGFEPLSRTVTLAASDVSDQNFNGSPGLYIGGKVVNLLGMGASGVEVLLNEGSAKTETTSDGSYSFTGLSAGKYTVAVNPDAHSARPLSISVELVGEGKENNNFLLTASSECPQVYFNFPFFGSYKQLVNIYGLYFGMSKPPEDELVTVGDSGVTLKSGVYFGTEDPETWVRAEVEFWSPVKIVVNAPDTFGFVYTWVIYLNEKDSGCYTTPYPTNFYLGF
jgi:protocatechuate 3,4-dioxygenase beta subunit